MIITPKSPSYNRIDDGRRFPVRPSIMCAFRKSAETHGILGVIDKSAQDGGTAEIFYTDLGDIYQK